MSRLACVATACLLAVAGAWLTAPASPAAAAQGQLDYDGCLADTADQGCFDLPFSPLQGASGVAVSADGKSVSAASIFSNSIGHFLRAPAAPPPLAEPPGGPAPSPSPGSSPRPAFGASTKVTVKLAAGGIAAKGPLTVVIANANAFAVTGTLTGTTTIGAKRGVVKLTAKRLTVAASARKTVELALSRALRRELRRKRKLVLRLSAAVQDPAGNRRTVRRQVSPRLKARRRS